MTASEDRKRAVLADAPISWEEIENRVFGAIAFTAIEGVSLDALSVSQLTKFIVAAVQEGANDTVTPAMLDALGIELLPPVRNV